MKTLLLFLFAALAVSGVRSQEGPWPGDWALVEGGTVRDTRSRFCGRVVSNFYIGKYEVTQKEWAEVMGNNPSRFSGETLPVESVSWYDCVEYCNKRSLREGLTPCYDIDKERKDPANKNEIDTIKWTVTPRRGANGYRLPTEMEWEYAAGGGRLSQGFTYSGGNALEEVAWYWRNSGDSALTDFWSWPAIEQNHNKTQPVGGKKPNELGLFDLSGNVREWCWDRLGDSARNGEGADESSDASARVWRGGGWLGGDFCCELFFRGSFEASGRGPDQGFRVCRSR